MEITGYVSRFLVAAVLVGIPAIASLPEARAEESRRRNPQRIAVLTEDERDPAVFERNLRSVAERSITLGAEVGLSAGILEHVAELERELAITGASQLAAAAQQMGPHVARVQRAMARIVVVAPAPDDVPAVPLDIPDPEGPWHKELEALAAAAYPTGYGINVNTEATGQGNSSPKVCSVHTELGCDEDEDCPEDETCINRPSTPSATQQVIIVRGCGSRPLEEALKALGESATDVEAAQMVMNRICNQVVLGFNGSIACIFTDLAALIQRRLLESEGTCKQLWAEAESRSSYSRLAHIKEKEEQLKAKALEIEASMLARFGTAETQVNGLQSETSTKFAAANTNINGTRSLLGTSINDTRNALNTNINTTRAALEAKINAARNLLNTNIDGTRTAVQGDINTTRTAVLGNLETAATLLNSNIEFTRNLLDTNIDDSRGSVNTNLDNSRVLINTNIDTTRATLLAQQTTQNELFLRAELERVLLHREKLALYYLPEAQGGKLAQLRQIVEATIARVEASNETVNQARTYLGYAVNDINAGRFKRAFGYLSSAYFEAIKSVGEQQTF